MALYRSKPQEVDAVQWDDTDDAVEALWEHTAGKVNVRFSPVGDRELWLEAGKDGAQEYVPVPVGHWVVHQPGDTTDIWPVDPDYFASKYVEA